MQSINAKLRQLIDAEDKSKPLRDDELTRELTDAGYKVARRTVTKCRRKMNIPGCRQRRDWSK